MEDEKISKASGKSCKGTKPGINLFFLISLAAEETEKSVKSSKKAKSASRRNLYFAIALVAAIALFGVFIAYDALNPYKYVFVSNGVEFVSPSPNPQGQLTALGNESMFIISPELREQGAINSYMTISLTLFSAVLTANNKTVITLARVIDGSGNLAYCQTNEGSTLTNKSLTASECMQWLSNSDYARVLVSLPNEKAPKARVVVAGKELKLLPKTPNDVATLSMETLVQMHSNATDVVERINQMLASLGTGG